MHCLGRSRDRGSGKEDRTIDLSRLFPWSEAKEEMEKMKEMMSHGGK